MIKMNKIPLLNAFGHNSQLKKFTKGRNKIKDLYLSEKKFFLDSVKNSKTFLDFGSAAGNFIDIIEKISKIKKYTGLDISEDMLKKAKLLHPRHEFKKFNGKRILMKSKFNLVYSFGTLIYCTNYQNLIKDFINLSDRYINFDVRLVFDQTLINKKKSYQIIAAKPLLKFPYVIINFNEFLEFLIKTTKCKYKISLFGYNHPVAGDVRSRYKNVLMTSVLIDKTKSFSLNIDIQK